MIFDSIAHAATYSGLDPRIAKALKLLEQDFSRLEDGRYEVDEDIYFMLQSYETKPANDYPESHRKYVDIQYVLSGTEIIGVGLLEEMEQVEAIPERDFYSNCGPMDYLTVTAGKFVVLWPQDAHAPGIAAGEPSQVRKCVVKVRLG